MKRYSFACVCICAIVVGSAGCRADQDRAAPSPLANEKQRVLPTITTLRTDELNLLSPRFKSSSQIESSPFGTHITSVFSEHVGDPKALIRDISKAGFKWVKDYIPAGNLRDTDDIEEYAKNWDPPDSAGVTLLQMAHDEKLQVMLRLSDYRFDGKTPTTAKARQGYARFCQQQVRNYRQWVKDWEVFNEPNIGNQNPWFKPKDYALLCIEAYKAIKAEDPEARVYVGATAMLQCLDEWPYPWITECLDAGVLGDVFSFHAYCQPYVRLNCPEHGSQFHPWNTWADYAHQLRDLRSKLDQSKITKGPDGHVPIANTEAGWPTQVDQGNWRREISFLTQAKYEQRAMLLDFWLGVRPRINFVFTRPFSDIYHIEGQFQLVNPPNALVNQDNRYRPAYFAAAAVCSHVDDTLKKTSQRVEIALLGTGAAEQQLKSLNPQVTSFQREHTNAGFVEVVIIIWAGVPAEDDFVAQPVRVTMDDRTDSVLTAPIGYSLLPVGATYSQMDNYRFNVEDLTYELSDKSMTLLAVPLSDAPYVIKYARKF